MAAEVPATGVAGALILSATRPRVRRTVAVKTVAYPPPHAVSCGHASLRLPRADHVAETPEEANRHAFTPRPSPSPAPAPARAPDPARAPRRHAHGDGRDVLDRPDAGLRGRAVPADRSDDGAWLGHGRGRSVRVLPHRGRLHRDGGLPGPPDGQRRAVEVIPLVRSARAP